MYVNNNNSINVNDIHTKSLKKKLYYSSIVHFGLLKTCVFSMLQFYKRTKARGPENALTMHLLVASEILTHGMILSVK